MGAMMRWIFLCTLLGWAGVQAQFRQLPVGQLVGIQYFCPEYALHIYCISPKYDYYHRRKLYPTMSELCSLSYAQSQALMAYKVNIDDTIVIRLYQVASKTYVPIKGPWLIYLGWNQHVFMRPEYQLAPRDTITGNGIMVSARKLAHFGRSIKLFPADYKQDAVSVPGLMMNATSPRFVQDTQSLSSDWNSPWHSAICDDAVICTRAYFAKHAADSCLYRSLYTVSLNIGGFMP